MLFRKHFNFDKFARKLILFYRIYESKFLILSPIAKRFVENLENIYKINVSVVDIHEGIANRLF